MSWDFSYIKRFLLGTHTMAAIVHATIVWRSLAVANSQPLGGLANLFPSSSQACQFVGLVTEQHIALSVCPLEKKHIKRQSFMKRNKGLPPSRLNDRWGVKE